MAASIGEDPFGGGLAGHGDGGASHVDRVGPAPVVVVNVGSSSVKLSRVEGPAAVADREVARDGPRLDQEELAGAVEALLGGEGREILAHRIVHGGDHGSGAELLSDEVLAELHRYSPFAPLHQPAALETATALRGRWPELRHVACFDTAFHATLPERAVTYALPAAWRALGLRRYGFHGLSYRSLLERIGAHLGRPVTDTAVVACHLGSGASACAILDGSSVDTTMGATPLAGLVMATRAGDVDPGVLLWLLAEAGIPPAELAEGLDRRSGLVALAGTARMEEVVARAGAGEASCRLALDVYCHQVARAVGAMAASLPRLDAVVFTGGVGERSPVVRAEVARRLGGLGVGIDDAANHDPPGDRDLSPPGARVRTLVLTAQEDLVAAAEARACVAGH